MKLSDSRFIYPDSFSFVKPTLVSILTFPYNRSKIFSWFFRKPSTGFPCCEGVEVFTWSPKPCVIWALLPSASLFPLFPIWSLELQPHWPLWCFSAMAGRLWFQGFWICCSLCLNFSIFIYSPCLSSCFILIWGTTSPVRPSVSHPWNSHDSPSLPPPWNFLSTPWLVSLPCAYCHLTCSL